MFGWLKPVGKFALGALGVGGGADENKIASTVAQILGGAGAGLAGMGQDAAANRGAQFEGQAMLDAIQTSRDRDYWDQSLQREQDGRASQSDAWRKLLHAQRISNPVARPNVSPYQAAQRMPTDMERSGADAMSQEVMARLSGGSSLPVPERRPVTVDPNLLKAGGLEKTSGWLAPILSFLGRDRNVAGTNPVGGR